MDHFVLVALVVLGCCTLVALGVSVRRRDQLEEAQAQLAAVLGQRDEAVRDAVHLGAQLDAARALAAQRQVAAELWRGNYFDLKDHVERRPADPNTAVMLPAMPWVGPLPQRPVPPAHADEVARQAEVLMAEVQAYLVRGGEA